MVAPWRKQPTMASSSAPDTTASSCRPISARPASRRWRSIAVRSRAADLSTLEDPRHPGFLHNTHAFFQRAITAMPWYGDLELERHGARYIEPELNVALLTGDGRALEWWTDPHKTDRIVRRLQPPRRRHVAALARRVRADRARYPGARGPLAAAAAAGAPRAAGTHQRRPAAARGERALAAAIRRTGVRAPHHQGRAPVLQRTARGRPAAAGLRPSHRRAAGEPGQGADVARRLGGARPRARSGGARERRRHQADDRAQAHSGRGRPRGRDRNRRRRSDPRPASRRVLAQSAPDLSRPAR